MSSGQKTAQEDYEDYRDLCKEHNVSMRGGDGLGAIDYTHFRELKNYARVIEVKPKFDLEAFRQDVLSDPLVYDIWHSKYRWKLADGTTMEDSVAETRERVVRAIYRDDPLQEAFDEALHAVQNGYFIPAGRINAGAGLDRRVTLTNCFVSATIQDSLPGIQRVINQAAYTMQQGGGIGTDYSTVRPHGAIVKRTGSVSSGVIPFMDQQNGMCQTIESAGTRRGAMMGTLRDDHPDLWNPDQYEFVSKFNGTKILKQPSFISAKRQKDRLDQFNVSVLISDAFMEAVQYDQMWELGFHVPRADGKHVSVYDKPFPYNEIDYDNEGNSWIGIDRDGNPLRKKGDMAPWYVYRRVSARVIWGDIMRSTYVYAEPGVIFIDRVNRLNNLIYCEEIRCTNPCGEQPLPEHGTCCLGSVNAAFMVKNPFTPQAIFDLSLFRKTVRTGIRFLDNVLTVTEFPLRAQKEESDAKRRIGLGVTGWADALAQLGVTYGSDASVKLSKVVAAELQEHSYLASMDLARERGSFPLYDYCKMLASPNIQKLPAYMLHHMKSHGLRNGVLNTVAPNGTISVYTGNTGSGIEPFFSVQPHNRNVRQADGSTGTYVSAYYAVRLYQAMHPELILPDYFVGAEQVSPLDHVRVQAAWQGHIDASISKTINCSVDLTFEEFEHVYMEAYNTGCKGCTTYRPDPTAGRGSVLSEDKPKDPLLTGAIDLLKVVVGMTEVVTDMKRNEVRDRPEVVDGRTHKLKWPPTAENIYVNVTRVNDEPLELFIKHADATLTEWTDGLSRMITGIMRRGGDVRFIVEQLKQVGSTKGGAFINGEYYFSQVAAIGGIIEKELNFTSAPVGVDVKHDKISTTFGNDLKTAPGGPGGKHAEVTGEKCPQCNAMTFIRENGCKKCLTCLFEACG